MGNYISFPLFFGLLVVFFIGLVIWANSIRWDD